MYPFNNFTKKSVLLMSLLALVVLPIIGQKSVIIRDDFETKYINSDVLIYNKSEGLEAKSRLLKKDEASFIQNTALQSVIYGYKWQQGWCKFKIHNKSSKTRFIVHIEQSRADSVQLFVVKSATNIDAMPILGRHVRIRQRIVYDRNYVYPIEIPQDSCYTYYLYSSRKVGLHGCIVMLKTEKDYARYFSVTSSQFGFIMGCTIITALIGFALYIFIRERTYLVYSLYCLSTTLVGFSDSGYIHGYFATPFLQPILNISTIIFFYLLVGLHILFTIELLNIRRFRSSWFYYLGWYSTWIFVGSAVVLLLPIPDWLEWWLVYLSYFVVFLMDLYIATAILIGIIKKRPSAYFYMVGFFLTLIIFTLIMLGNLNVLDGVNNKVDLFYFMPLIEIIVMIIGLGIRFSDTIKERFIYQKKLNETQHQLITIQEDERKRIARDLHDGVGNSLAAIKAKFSHKDRLVEAEQTQRIIDDLRDITHNIMPADFQEFKLDETLRALINRFQKNSKIEFEFIRAGTPVKLDSNKELAIYRVVNELITNLLKHSVANEVTIQLVYQPDRVVLSFEDNGQPFSIKEYNSPKSTIGIKSILTRLEYIQAKFSASSDENGNILIIDILYAPIYQNTNH